MTGLLETNLEKFAKIRKGGKHGKNKSKCEVYLVSGHLVSVNEPFPTI
jgi:hypothetical protein